MLDSFWFILHNYVDDRNMQISFFPWNSMTLGDFTLQPSSSKFTKRRVYLLAVATFHKWLKYFVKENFGFKANLQYVGTSSPLI